MVQGRDVNEGRERGVCSVEAPRQDGPSREGAEKKHHNLSHSSSFIPLTRYNGPSGRQGSPSCVICGVSLPSTEQGKERI